MKRFVLAAVLAVLAVPASAQVGFSLSIGQPGFFGRIDVGGYPQPQLIYPEPVLVQHVAYADPPIYLRVPAYHSGNWRRYCGDYNACGQRVYFVQDTWYQSEYVPRYRKQHVVRHPAYRDARWDYRPAPDNWYYRGYAMRNQERDRDYHRGARNENRGGHRSDSPNERRNDGRDDDDDDGNRGGRDR